MIALMGGIIIIGGGPAGLIAAERLAQAGKAVSVYDRKPSVGRKFLMAGRGGLNLTHSEPLDDFLKRYGTTEHILAPLLRNFTPDDLRRWCEGLGQETFVGSSGRVFPKSMKASPLLRAWIARLDSLGVKFHLQRTWRGWSDNGDLVFTNAAGKTEETSSNATLLALGGASWPGLGSDGSWTKILEQRGVEISDLRPSNCGFVVPWSDYIRDRAGQPLKNIGLSFGDKTVRGEIMIAQNGIEGGAVYALSSAIRESIADNGIASVAIDLRPNMDITDIIDKLQTPRARNSFSTYLQKTLTLSPLSIAILRESCADIQNKTPENIAALIKSLPLSLTAPFSIDRAISSAGGIAFSALTEDLMIESLPGVFAAGEMLDWEAPTGGYLLQASFATGIAAADGILRRL